MNPAPPNTSLRLAAPTSADPTNPIWYYDVGPHYLIARNPSGTWNYACCGGDTAHKAKRYATFALLLADHVTETGDPHYYAQVCEDIFPGGLYSAGLQVHGVTGIPIGAACSIAT